MGKEADPMNASVESGMIMDRAFLIGEKIYLRPLELEDVNEKYLQWVNDPEVVLGRIESYFPMTRDKQIEYVRSQLARKDVVMFAVIEKHTDSFIGVVKIGPINWIHRYTEHAFMIGDKSCWNKGYAREGILLILDYIFRHLNLLNVYAGASSPNRASIRKNERNGYKIEGIFKNKLFVNGNYVDHVIMSLSREEFLKRNPEPIVVRTFGKNISDRDESSDQ
jgi:RimJ/RimL family protein N-acetyltransferase